MGRETVKRTWLALAIVTVTMTTSGRIQAQEPGPSAEVPELAVLSGYAGRWESRYEAKRIEGVNEGGDRKGTAEAQWILDGRFLRQNWTSAPTGSDPGMSGYSIMTYDPAKRAYRSWHFVSNGSTSEGTGTYDEKTKTLTWVARDTANGLVTTTKTSFDKGEGSENWVIIVALTDGKVVADLKGKNTRRKK